MIATTKEQVEILREGGKRLAIIMQELGKAVVPGATTDAIDALAERLIRDGGDEPALLGYTPHGAKRPFPATLCLSINEEVVHGIPNENPRVINEGDVVGLDCVLIHKGLFVDTALTVIAGKGDKEAEELLSATKKALMAGIAAAKVGKNIGDISHAIEESGIESGFGVVYELGGHGVGNQVHEQPYVPNVGEEGEGEELVEGMVLAIEPMLTEGTAKVKLLSDGYTFVTRDGSRSAHFEHTILITKEGAEILTKA